MWFIGALLGLIIGGIAEGASLAVIFAIAGGVIGGILSSSKKKKNAAWRAQQTEAEPQTTATQAHETWGRQEASNPLHRINQLEQRVGQLEFELAELRAHLHGSSDSLKSVSLQPHDLASTLAPAPVPAPAANIAAAVEQFDEKLSLMPLAKDDAAEHAEVAMQRDSGETTRPAPSTEEFSASQKLEFDELQSPTLEPISSTTAPQEAIELADVAFSDDTISSTPQPPATKFKEPAVAALSWRERLPAPLADFLFGGNWLVKSGVAILFLGLAFLLRYTSEYISIPVEFRYLAVAAAAVTSVALGWRLRTKNANFGLTLQGLGIGSFYLTALFALKLHHLIDHLPCFVFLFAMSVLAAALAVLQKAPSLAIVASLAGFATPVLSGSGENNPVGLFTYLAILDIGIAIIAWFQAWRMLNLIGFVGTFALAAGWADRYYSEASYSVAQAYLILFGLIYAFVGLFYARNTLRDVNLTESLLTSVKRVGRIDSALVFGLPITAFAIQYVLVKDFYLGSALAATGYALFYLVLARLVYAKQTPGLSLLAEAYLIVAAIFLTLAIPLALENSWTGAAWAVEGAGMYWLGVRQQRPYARAFAFLVLLGAWCKLSFALSFSVSAVDPVLSGSWIGPLILLISSVTVWHLFSKLLTSADAPANPTPTVGFNRVFATLEPQLRQGSLWIGWLALVSLCWVLFDSRLAAVIEAIAGAVLIRLADKKHACVDFHWRGVALQVLAVLQFAVTLQSNSSGEAVLASGWQGIVASCLIAAAILSNIIFTVVRHRRQALADGRTLVWSKAFNLGLLVASLLLQFSLLFAFNLNQVAMFWSLSAALFIALALYLANFVLALGSGMLLVVSLAIYAVSSRIYNTDVSAFWNVQFAAPLSLSLACLFVAERIYRAANKGPWPWPLEPAGSARLHNGWCHKWQWQLIPLLPGLWFWFSAFSIEPGIWLAQHELARYWGVAQLLCSLTSAGLLFLLSKKREWRWAAYAQFIYLPWLVWLLNSLKIRAEFEQISFIPMLGVDYLVWLFAFFSHFVLLRKAQSHIAQQSYFLQAMHALGLWFFVFLFSLQLHALAYSVTAVENTWTATAWLVFPMLSVIVIISNKWLARWPWLEWREFYVTKAAYPLLTFCWLWFGYTALTQDGNAQPLPFISILNPLELGQLLCVLVSLLWWRAMPELWQRGFLELRAHYALALASLLWYTTVVLRACSQYAGIPYEFEQLFDAKLSQAAVSVAWALAAVISMLMANRRQYRSLWVAGAVLLAIVVLKLFVIELADHGGLYRIISFIVVGLLLLVVGYFAPYPGSNLKQKNTAELPS